MVLMESLELLHIHPLYLFCDLCDNFPNSRLTHFQKIVIVGLVMKSTFWKARRKERKALSKKVRVSLL